jgi:Arc/MetJ family transcription regulator
MQSMGKIEIDEAVVGELMEITGLKTQQEVVDKALKEMVDRRRVQRKLLELEGKIEWDGDLDAMRRNR